jgi:8-oxo-dGTP pyrophosphatase MutT (NUDIX family)
VALSLATDQWGYELLGGLVEEGEDPAATAAREAVEESGWAPVGDPEKLISFEPLPGNVTAPVDVFLWRRAEQIGVWGSRSRPWALICGFRPRVRPAFRVIQAG